jgi:hypothetical protein
VFLNPVSCVCFFGVTFLETWLHLHFILVYYIHFKLLSVVVNVEVSPNYLLTLVFMRCKEFFLVSNSKSCGIGSSKLWLFLHFYSVLVWCVL